MAAPVWAHVYGLLCGVAAPCGRCGGPYRGRAAAPFAFTPAISPPPATATWDATDRARACMRWVHSSPRGLLPPVCTSHAAWGVSRAIAEGKETPRHRVTAGRAGGVRHVRGEAERRGPRGRGARARVRVRSLQSRVGCGPPCEGWHCHLPFFERSEQTSSVTK